MFDKHIEKYQVLYIEVLENKSLLDLQATIGNHYGGIKWRYRPDQTGDIPYNPHIAVAFVKEGVVEKLAEAPFVGEELIVSEIILRKFRDSSVAPIILPLRT